MTRTLGAWDCSYCKTKKILGNVFDCPGCGHPRPRGVRFYQIPNAPIVTPEIAAQLGSGDPNWYCDWCDSGNKDNNQKCWKCGAERGTAPSHEVKRFLQDEAVPQSTEEAEASDPDGKSWVEEPKVPAVPIPIPINNDDEEESSYIDSSDNEELGIQSSNNTGLGKIKPFAIGALILVGIAVVSFFIYQLFFNSHEEMVRVSGFNWTQSVTVQEYRTVRESSWSSTPSGAYDIYSDYRDTGRDEKIHDGWDTVEYEDTCYKTEDYPDTCTDSKYVSDSCTSTTDNGDGSFDTDTYECGGYESFTYSCTKSRQVPYSCTKTRQEERYHYEDIYDWYYEYNIDKWVSIANYATSGNDHNPHYFSDFVLSDPYDGYSPPRLGQQQQFLVPGDYYVTFLCDNHKVGDEGYFTRKYSESDWALFNYEVGYPIEVNFFNGVLSFPIP